MPIQGWFRHRLAKYFWATVLVFAFKVIWFFFLEETEKCITVKINCIKCQLICKHSFLLFFVMIYEMQFHKFCCIIYLIMHIGFTSRKFPTFLNSPFIREYSLLNTAPSLLSVGYTFSWILWTQVNHKFRCP